MMKVFLLLCVLSVAGAVSAANIYVDYDDSGGVTFTWDAPDTDCLLTNSDWEDEFYKFKLKKKYGSWDTPHYTSLNSLGVYYPASFFEEGKTYKMKVKYYTKNRKCRGIARSKKLAVDTFTYHFQQDVVPPNLEDIHDDAVLIRNMSFEKCVYPYFSTAVYQHNWTCWSDPGMAYTILDTGVFNEVKIRSEATGKCIQPLNAVDYATVSEGSCTSAYSVYVLQDAGTGPDQFRLMNKLNSKCLYGSPDDGGFVRQFGCWSNPDMVFKFEDF